jgi:hypothetical protein
MIGPHNMSAFRTPVSSCVMMSYSKANRVNAWISNSVRLGDVLTGVSPVLLSAQRGIELELTQSSWDTLQSGPAPAPVSVAYG